MKTGWLLYDEGDLQQNRDFAEYMEKEAKKRDLDLQTVRTAQLTLGVKAGGTLRLQKDGRDTLPDFVISRQRDDFISVQFEQLGVKVLNGAKVCRICNDKRRTHQFLAGLPMMETTFVSHRHAVSPEKSAFPLVVKPACSHGGDRVRRVTNEYEWREAVDAIIPQDFLQQKPAGDAGQDLRVYVVFGQIVTSVMRTAKHGFLSNFKRGGAVDMHTLTTEETALAMQVIDRFAKANAPLCFAGVDLLFDQGKPVIGEVEDVVGSRMLYQESHMDIAALYLDGIRDRL